MKEHDDRAAAPRVLILDGPRGQLYFRHGGPRSARRSLQPVLRIISESFGPPDRRYAVPARRGQPVCLARKKASATIAIPIGIVITSIQYQAAATVIAPAATRPMPSNGLRLLVSSPAPT